ncbi:ras-related protein Rab-39A-like [Macrobrachium nipponense]|uniref:ras-related protein Rab-39A-like n=1 Tax=Macrobrachium nipponense TaxID=159736 RepID=UPI0030C80574
MVEPIFDYQFRLILIGDSTVGKSSLLKYFTDGKFFEIDMEEEREVKSEDALSLANFYNIKYIETSSVKGINVEEAFRSITQEVYDKVQNGEFKIEEGWDGIKSGYSRPNHSYNIMEAEPEKSGFCC